MKRLLASMSFLFWTGIIICVYYVVQKPNLTPFTGLADTLWTLLVTTILLFNSYGFGTRFLNLSGLKSIDAGDRLLLGLGLGLGGLSFLGLGFSALQFANASTLTIFQIGLATFFVLANDLTKLRDDIKVLTANLNISFSQSSIFTKLAIFLPFAFSFTLTLVPPFEAFDALLYHLALPARILQDGGLHAIDNAPFWFPSLTENVYLWALAMRSERAAQIIHLAWGTLTMLLLWHWAVKVWNTGIGRKILLLLAAIPSLPMLASWAYADMALAFYATATLYTLTLSESTKTPAWLRITGFMAGLAMGVKYTSFTVPLTVLLIILLWRRRQLAQAVTHAAQFGITALLIALPWYVRNMVLMGNPFYPFVFGGRYWDGFLSGWYADAGTGIGWNALQILLLPLNIVLGYQDATFFDGRIGPLFLLLAPFTVWILLSRMRRDSAESLSIVSIGLFSGLSFAAWTLGVINSSALWQARLLLPALMTFTIPSALGWDSLKKVDTSKFHISFLINGVITIIIALTIFENGMFVLQRDPLAVALGVQSRGKYIERVNPSYAALIQIMDELPADARVYSLFEPRSYGLPRMIQPDPIVYNFPHDLYLYQTPAKIIEHWKSLGYTHILLYQTGLNFLVNTRPDRMTTARQDALRETLKELEPISQTPDKVYSLYKIP